MKNRRMELRTDETTANKITELTKTSGMNQTRIIEAAINYIHGEYRRALKGMEHDEVMISQVLGDINPRFQAVK